MNFGSKIHSKSIKNDTQDGMSHLASITSVETHENCFKLLQDDPKTPQRWPPSRPGRPQDSPKTSPGGLLGSLQGLSGSPMTPLTPQEAPMTAQYLNFGASRPHFGASRPHFGAHQASFWSLWVQIIQ